MTIQEAYKTLLFQLYEIYDNRESANITNLVIEHVTGLSKIDRIVNKDFHLSAIQQTNLEIITQKLLNFIPVQYAVQQCWFYGLAFYVDEHVLIPRPETEELTEWIITDVKANQQNKIKILDIGTGSGCISIALKNKMPEVDISSIDVSDKALAVAQKNAASLNTVIDFKQLDFLEENNWLNLDCFDVVVSNPPYIKKSEKEQMHDNVLRHEPHLALFVDNDDALLFYRKIAQFGKKHLNSNGCIYVEINETLGDETKKCFEKFGYRVELKKDLQGKNRMLKAAF